MRSPLQSQCLAAVGLASLATLGLVARDRSASDAMPIRATVFQGLQPVASTQATVASSIPTGYRLVGSDGSVYAFGALHAGSLRGRPLHQPIVGMASTPRFGYWIVASDGGIFSFGDARFHGSTGNFHLNQPIVGIAAQVLPAPYQPLTTGYDISWPQCRSPFPVLPHAITIVGVNNGHTYSANPCLASEAAWAGGSLTVYVNTDALPFDNVSGLNGPAGACAVTDLHCRAYNWGRGHANYSYAAAQTAQVNPAMWWLDVETGNRWRYDDEHLNVDAIRGMLDGLRSHGLLVGIYSTSYQWNYITNSTWSPGVPLWVPGARDAFQATQYCDQSHAFGGGTIWLTQWTTIYDQNFACPQ